VIRRLKVRDGGVMTTVAKKHTDPSFVRMIEQVHTGIAKRADATGH
jgi:hypothetical protein